MMGGDTGVGMRAGALTGGADVAGVGVESEVFGLFQNPHALLVDDLVGMGTGVGVRTSGVVRGGGDAVGFAALTHTFDSG